MLVTLILVAQFVLCTPAAFAFARLSFPGPRHDVRPRAAAADDHAGRAAGRELPHAWRDLGLVDTILAIALPYLGSAFGIFLLRQTFRTVPQELDDAARLEGCSLLARLWRVYVPLARPTYIAYGLVSVSYHWNNFLWPLVITNSVTTRPLTVGPVGVRLHRPGHRLVDHHRRHTDDLRPAAGCLPAVPAAVRAELHARRNPMTALERRLETAIRIAEQAGALALSPAPAARARPPTPR